ncbi:UDP-glycosyltransferase 1-like [Hordeum vulgare subsp. vulgare]|uniref:Glycosyltransferase n=1 Tax=Hordeum vulgare subsp. vulgare TaxID=112509 RepID=A0A8I6XAZ7_HORVV|nr:UDP-glycosyltransferase 1-like [Hordeum vulgare subsp. vulgare]
MVGAGTNTTMGSRKPRVVLYPSPGMGHLVSMIELGKLFAARGLAVTVALMDSPHDTSATGPFLAGVSAANPAISFHRLPQVELLGSEPPEMLTFEVARLSNPHLRDFLAGDAPAVIVLDFFCSAAIDVAAELGIPAYFFCTSGAQILAFFLHLAVLHGKSARSFGEMGQELVHAPGISSFPATHAVQRLMDRDSAPYKAFLSMSTDLFRSQGIIVNTFRSLEPRAMDTIVAGLCAPSGLRTPPVYCIGPLIKSEEVGVKRGDGCLAWLDAQPKGSVVFLSFGSLGRFSAKQTREVAAGLEASGQRFLWVVRSPPSDDSSSKKNSEKPPEPDLDDLLPEGFLDRTKGRGLVVKSWAPQRDVLAHDAVGCFVTHCGWNSVLESVMAGVPMLAWPLYAEQRMNAVFLEKEMELAVAMEGYDREMVEAEEVAKKVRWMMDSDGGRVLRERTLTVMRRAEEALLEGGESEATLAGLVDAWIRA